jgi:hypothetical protein
LEPRFSPLRNDDIAGWRFVSRISRKGIKTHGGVLTKMVNTDIIHLLAIGR